MKRPIRYARQALPCHACYRPLTVAEQHAGHYCDSCRSSGAADRHEATRYRLEASP